MYRANLKSIFRLLLWLGVFGFHQLLPAQDAKAASTTSNTSAPAMTSPLGPDDILEITVFQEEDLTTKARVSQTGTISFPLIGEVKIGGLSPDAAAKVIRSALAKEYLVNPQVSVIVTDYNKRRFTVLGEVQKPGSYEMPDRVDVSLLMAIGTAGGYTRIANAGDIRVKRTVNGRETVYKINAKDMANGKEISGFVILPDDVITVGESIL